MRKILFNNNYQLQAKRGPRRVRVENDWQLSPTRRVAKLSATFLQVWITPAMSQQYPSLLACFIAERRNLARYLTGRTGCSATAEDLLQDAWFKLNRLSGEPVDNPLAYLRRMAANLAIDDARANARRLLDPVEIELLLEVPDEAPNAEQAISDRQQLQRLAEILEELPERRRELFLAARLEGQPHKALAQRFGVSLRTVELEVRRALDHCALRLRQQGGGPAPRRETPPT
jgi:RNA polymerase sigma-70 factor (ECF subfamily)